MTKSQSFFLFLSRLSVGFMMFYAGITKVIDPTWSSVGYLKGAKLLTGFYTFLQGSSILPIVDFVNEWGLTLLGISLILGIGIRLSAPLGALLMILYYIPLGFPYPNPHALIVDEHIIYATVLLFFASIDAGKYLGLSNKMQGTFLGRIPLFGKYM
jgi:thiosulfate dehydrogenase [quinone] large subunit